MLSNTTPHAAIALELIGLAYGAAFVWLGGSLRAEIAGLGRWRTAAWVIATGFIAGGLWWPSHVHVERHDWASYVALIAAVLLTLSAAPVGEQKRSLRHSTLAAPIVMASAVVFVLACCAQNLASVSAFGFIRVVAASIGLAAAMVWLHKPAAKALHIRVAASVATAVLVSAAEWAPAVQAPVGSLVLEMVAMSVVLALGASLFGMLRHSRVKVATVTAQKDREALDNDPLTRLATRRSFERSLAAVVAQAHRDREPLALFFIDIDGFKAVNDSYGHAAGDRVLVEMARRLQKVCRPNDVLARVGADEFLLLNREDAESSAAEALAQRILLHADRPFPIAGNSVSLVCSVGIVRYPKHGPIDQLIGRAEAASQAAKRAGGGRHKIYDQSMDSGARDRLALTSELRTAIERGQLELYYQPKVDAASLQISGVEALIRWNHPQRGLVSPGVFIPIAEQNGLIEMIGGWVIDEACRQIGVWREAGLRMRVSINLSPHQLGQADLVPRILGALKKHRVEAQLLTCEITESAAMSDTTDTQACLRAMGQAGMHVSIDDFGTGYSSLSYLRKLPAEELKIDRSFVSDLETSTDARAVADAVIKLAHALGLRVVAEGVETQAQAAFLVRMGCNQLQGYLYGKPMPAAHLLDWALDRQQSAAPFRSSLFVDAPDKATA